MRILAISGSLRAASSNTSALLALQRLAPPTVTVRLFPHLGELPYFNPDLDTDEPPVPVRELRAAVGAADGLVICSPEYAHGVAGVMKNALDWLVRSLEFPGKPVALINASPRADRADAHVREILQVMSARLVETASVQVPLQGRGLAVEQIVADPALAGVLRGALDAFLAEIGAFRAEED